MGYIYKIINLSNQKLYIGQTKKTIEERFKNHLKLAKRHINRCLYDAMNKYGYDNFTIKQIEQIPDQYLDEREKYWITYYNTTNRNYGYNMTAGGGGGDTWTNNPHKKETSKKISENNKGKHSLSPQQHQRMIQRAKEVNTIKINKQELENDIKNFMSIEDICEKYHISRKTFYNKCKEFFKATPTEIRGDKFTHTNTMKIYINKQQLDKLLKQKKSLEEMAKFFKVSKETIRRNIIKYYGKNLKEVRKDVESKN